MPRQFNFNTDTIDEESNDSSVSEDNGNDYTSQTINTKNSSASLTSQVRSAKNQKKLDGISMNDVQWILILKQLRNPNVDIDTLIDSLN